MHSQLRNPALQLAKDQDSQPPLYFECKLLYLYPTCNFHRSLSLYNLTRSCKSTKVSYGLCLNHTLKHDDYLQLPVTYIKVYQRPEGK